MDLDSDDLSEDSQSSDSRDWDNVLLTSYMTKSKSLLKDLLPNYEKDTFFYHFRVSRGVAAKIAKMYSESSHYYEIKDGKYGKLSALNQVVIFLWFVGQLTSNTRSICDRFNISLSTLNTILRRVILFLSDLSPEIIKWPNDEEKKISEAFFKLKGFPNVIGAIDGNHIRIDKPVEDSDSYVNKKGYHSIQMQAVCDHNHKIIDIFVGYPGSEQDNQGFRKSPLYQKLEEKCGQYCLLGDRGYPLLKNLLIPFKDKGQLTEKQRNYNKKLNENRYIIDHCLGILKEKFRHLYYIKFKINDAIAHFIRACCVLHNFALEDDFIVNIDKHMLEEQSELTADLEDEESENETDVRLVRDRIVDLIASNSRDEDDVIEIATDPITSNDEETVMDTDPKIGGKNVLDETMPNYDVETFFDYFRVSKDLAIKIAERYSESLFYKDDKQGKFGNIPALQQVSIFLWFVGRLASSFKDVHEQFNISMSSVHRIIKKVTLFLSSLSPEIIKWPNEEEKKISEAFFRTKGFPNMIGAIDGNHVRIDKPVNDPDSYINRKGYYSIQMQAVCDHNHKIIDFFVGYPGSEQDIQGFRKSPLYQVLDEKCGQYCLVGDSGYPLLKNLLTPFKDKGQLTESQINYNKKLNKNRYIIDHCIGILKEKFRQLYYIKFRNNDIIVQFIQACSVLYNIALEDDFIVNIDKHMLKEQSELTSDFLDDEDVDARLVRDTIVDIIAANQREEDALRQSEEITRREKLLEETVPNNEDVVLQMETDPVTISENLLKETVSKNGDDVLEIETDPVTTSKNLLKEIVPNNGDDVLEMETDTVTTSENLLEEIVPVSKTPTYTIARIRTLFEDMVPNYDENTFFDHFRVSQSVALKIADRYRESTYYNEDKYGSCGKISALKQVVIFLRFVGQPVSNYREITERFNISMSSMHRIIKRLSFFLSNLSPEIIKWPNDEDKKISEAFFRSKGFPNMIGAIDRCHIKINKPAKDTDSYKNRNGYYSIQIQAVCDHNYKFINIFVGCPGSLSNKQVFRKSPLYEKLEEKCGSFVILGDRGYPLMTNLLTPFKDGKMTRRQKNYNIKLNQNRSFIEHSFEILKQKFRQLNHIKLKYVEFIIHFIRACCVLHNITLEDDFIIHIEEQSLTVQSELTDDLEDEETEDEDDANAQMVRKRTVDLLTSLPVNEYDVLEVVTDDTTTRSENLLEEYDDESFMDHFRISREVATKIAECYSESWYYNEIKHGKYGKISALKQVLIFLCFVGQRTSNFREVTDRFIISTSSLHRIVKRLSFFLSNLSPEIIKWPDEEEKRISEAFFRSKGFPNMIGAIDGCQIKISKPAEDTEAYKNKKGYYSIQMQIVCDHNHRIIDMFVGSPGSLSDNQVFRKSPLYQNIEEKCGVFFMLGDNGYPLLKNLLTPYKHRGQLNRRQLNFNIKLNQNRYIVENCFEILKQKFRLLNHIKLKSAEVIIHFIQACCVLHNVALEDDFIFNIEEQRPTVQSAFTADLEDEDAEDEMDARFVREAIVDLLA